MNKVHDILKQFDRLSKAELAQISEGLLKLLQSTDGVVYASSNSVHTCRKCGDEKIVKFGKDKNGKQRYRCKTCGATFTETSYSVVSNTRHTMDVWEKYIALLLDRKTLAVCAKQCKISIRTAFIWRHKILSALQRNQDDQVLSGIVELDELYVPISFKGNHTKSKRFTMPRKSYKRGTDNACLRAEEKACVMYAVERDGVAYGECLGNGQISEKKVAFAFDHRLVPESIVLTDCAHPIKRYFDSLETVEQIQLKSHKAGSKQHKSPPEIKGVYHIQNVNNLHTRFRRFMRTYNGVATKYLNHYVGLFIWIENFRRSGNGNINEDTRKYICESDGYVSNEYIFNYPPIPVCA